MTIERPPYLYPAGSVVMHSPLQLRDAEMYGFFVKGDKHKLQHSVDATLNRVAGDRMQFKVLSSYVMLTFTRVNHADSANPADRDKGWITEIDIVTWILVARLEGDDGSREFRGLYWYPFHIWVDDSMALINGRELFGYPKYECEYVIPPRDAEPDRFALAVKAFQPFSEQTEIALHPLLEVTAVDGVAAHRAFADMGTVLPEVLAALKSVPDFLDLDIVGWEDALAPLWRLEMPQIFLKQFPDSAGERAVYQAIVTAPAKIDKIHSVRLLGNQYRCTLHEVASFPLAQSLGLAVGEQPVLLPFNVHFDFTVTPGEELVDNSCVAPRKIAVLGGGVGAMTAAFYLTDQPGWQERYDITVYQMGWRLGGKGASGRNAKFGQRIEEHGLHIWFGFYDNAFGVMRKAYELLQRAPGAPLRTWKDAFKPHDYIVLTEFINKEWKIWPLEFPYKPGEPGDGAEEITIWQLALSLYAWVKQWLEALRRGHVPAARSPAIVPPDHRPDWLHKLARMAAFGLDHLAHDVLQTWHAAQTLAQGLRHGPTRRGEDDHEALAGALDAVHRWLADTFTDQLDTDDELRRLFVGVDLGVTVLRGMFADGVFEHGFDVINGEDFRAWLRRHGANQTYTVNSAPVIGFYDLVFAYRQGDINKPDAEAGTLLRAMLRIALLYKGGVMWKMQAGMGDTVFTPLYQVLKKRGVKFKFFHKVEELIPQADAVGAIRMTKQVTVANGDENYDPFVFVNGLACWPSTPNYHQIVAPQAKLLQANDVNLESHWSNWPQLYRQAFGEPPPQLTLKRGRDFDDVVFGISLGSIPHLCPALLTQSQPLKTLTEKVETVVTQAYQVWLTRDLRALGWNAWPKNGQEPVLSAFTEPFDTWAPMDQLLAREDWPPGPDAPSNVSYFCSAMPVANFPPPDDHEFPAQCAERAQAAAKHQLTHEVHALWPQAASANSFRWEWLTDPAGGSGEARFASQFWRANIDPSERYVLSVTDSSRYRLTTDGAGFTNLYLTGDWIKTGLNAGCVEAAVMAGMQTSRAISGYPQKIKGEVDF